MPTDKEKAEAAEILAQPLEPAPEPFHRIAAIFSSDGKPTDQLNPDFIEWNSQLLRRLLAVATLFGVDSKPDVAEMNWHAVALGLACRYHPSFKPKKRRGRSRTKFSDARYNARRELLKLVKLHMERLVGRKSIEAILPNLKRDKHLPAMFKSMPRNTLRQEISIAKKERTQFQKAMADLLTEPSTPTDYRQLLISYEPGKDFVPSGRLFGLRLTRPMGNSD